MKDPRDVQDNEDDYLDDEIVIGSEYFTKDFDEVAEEEVRQAEQDDRDDDMAEHFGY